ITGRNPFTRMPVIVILFTSVPGRVNIKSPGYVAFPSTSTMSPGLSSGATSCNFVYVRVGPTWYVVEYAVLQKTTTTNSVPISCFIDSPFVREVKAVFPGDAVRSVDTKNIVAISYAAWRLLAQACSEHVHSHFQLRKNLRLDLTRKKH